VYAITDGGSRVAARAQLRASTNIGVGVGTLLAGIALTAGTRAAYTALIAGGAGLFMVTAVLVARLPSGPATRTAPAQGRRRTITSPLRDAPYLAVAAADGLLSIYAPTLTFAMPLWVVGHTRAPAWSVSAILIVNTVMVIALQVRVSAGAESIEGTRRYARRAGLAFAAGCLLFFAAPGLGPIGATCLMLLWAGLVTVGELLQSSCYFYCSQELAPDEAQASYQSVYALGPGVMRAAGPALLTLVVFDRGGVGWVYLAALFAIAGLAVSAAAGWASSTRKPVPASSWSRA
jgi:hypothetical protein